jgi:RimJ/RimL family protein N-acetyltransferase
MLTGKLIGNTIYLRSLTALDVNDQYLHWLNDPQVNQYLETRFSVQSLKSIGDFVHQMNESKYDWLMAICDKHNDTHVGNIKLGPLNTIHLCADISLFIGDKTYWGRGIATEAIRLIAGFAFEQLNLHKVKAGCYVTNLGSYHAFKKAGFTLEGTLRNQYRSGDGYVDCYLLGLLEHEWNRI